MPEPQAIGASLRVMCRAKKNQRRVIPLWFQCSSDDPVGKSAGCSTVLRARSNPFISLLLIDGWYCPHVPIRKMLRIWPYAEFPSLRFASSEVVVILKRDSTASGWLVLFSLEVTIIKWSHLIVSATVFLPLSLSCARRNNLQQTRTQS